MNNQKLPKEWQPRSHWKTANKPILICLLLIFGYMVVMGFSSDAKATAAILVLIIIPIYLILDIVISIFKERLKAKTSKKLR